VRNRMSTKSRHVGVGMNLNNGKVLLRYELSHQKRQLFIRKRRHRQNFKIGIPSSLKICILCHDYPNLA
jgi:hypothetical protein